MFNHLLLYTTLTSMQYTSIVNVENKTPSVQQYTPSTISNVYDGIINTTEVSKSNVCDGIINTTEASKKNVLGAYPWEIVRPYEDGIYFLYENYFRVGGKATRDSKVYHYFQELGRRKHGITRRLVNPIDRKSVRYFSIGNILPVMSLKIEKAIKKNYVSSLRLLYYRQVVLDLQKESLDYQQSILDMALKSL